MTYVDPTPEDEAIAKRMVERIKRWSRHERSRRINTMVGTVTKTEFNENLRRAELDMTHQHPERYHGD